MKLTQILLKVLRLKNVQKPLRRLTSGKHRLPRVVTLFDKRMLLKDLAREEENLFYLSQPYLTPEQDKVLIEKHRSEEGDGVAQFRHERTLQRMFKHVSFDERLAHLKVTEKWE